MRFLIDADLSRRTAGLLKSYGHESVDVRDVGLGGASDEQVAAYACAHEMCLLTGDFGFADIRNYPPERFGGLVVLEIPKNGTADMILRLLESLLRQADIVERLPGRLAIVEWGNVRIRPKHRPQGRS
jgi:predicted nuclease of predicted toxin-antitoxin system